MSRTTTVTVESKDAKRGMTIAELEDFAAAAREAGADGTDAVKVRTGWRSQIARLSVETYRTA